NTGSARRIGPNHMTHDMDLGAGQREIQAKWQQAVGLHPPGGLNAGAVFTDIENFAEFEDDPLRAATQTGIGRGVHKMPAGAPPVPPKNRSPPVAVPGHSCAVHGKMPIILPHVSSPPMPFQVTPGYVS